MGGLAHAIPLTGSDQIVAAGAAVLVGYTVRETAGAAAVVRIYDHEAAASGTILAAVALAANESVDVMYPRPARAVRGVFVDVVSGAVEGSVRIG
ncbi:hypothetical protein [Nonomuraea sp. NPDC050202]|uniref:hypothetical protein n=1 Tax=Nonomuraea sp. NPDC050202 TaxID=3155035 RepID=UPI0033D368A3